MSCFGKLAVAPRVSDLAIYHEGTPLASKPVMTAMCLSHTLTANCLYTIGA